MNARSKICPSILLLGLAALAGPARAQSLDPAAQKIFDEWKEAQALNDVRAMERLGQRNKKELSAAFDIVEFDLGQSDDLDTWQLFKDLARTLDAVDATNVLAIRANMLSKLSIDQRVEWFQARNDYVGTRAGLQAAVKAKDGEAANPLVAALDELGKKFEQLGDAEYACYCMAEIANALVVFDQQLEAVKWLDRVDQMATRAGYDHWRFHSDSAAERDRLKAAGHDPDKAGQPGAEAEGEGANSGTSWSKDPEGQRYSDPVPLKYVFAKDLPWKFTTPSFRSGENTQHWQGWSLGGNGPANFEDRFKPLGLTLKFRRDGGKLYMDDGQGGKEQELRVISKPNPIELEKDYTDWEGNKQKLKYAWLAACGNSSETFFGMSVNAAPGPDNFGIRYYPACYLKGTVLGEELIIIDDNATGAFGDPMMIRDLSSASEPAYVYNDAMIFGGGNEAGPWTEFLEVDGAFYRLKLDPESYEVRTRKLDVQSGFVKVKWNGPVEPQSLIIGETRNFKGAYFAVGKKPVRVPVGTYQFSYGIIRKGTKNAQKMCIISTGDFVAFDVKPDQTVELELGAPFTFRYKTERLPNGDVKVIGKTIEVYGKRGELYCRFHDEPPIPDKVVLRVKGGGAVGRPSAMERATFEDYQRDPASVYQPLDLVLKADAEKDYEVELACKKNVLLGGPIESGEN